MSDNSIKESLENQHDDSPLEKPVKIKVTDDVSVPKDKKPRKPKTPGQLEQFEKIRLKRLENLNKKREDKKLESAKLLLNNGYVKAEAKPTSFKENIPLTPTHQETDSGSEQSEVIIIKKKKKPKKKTIIIEESESESEEEPKYEDIVKTRNMISQRNKKSLLKIHKKEKSPHDYFM